MKRWLLGLSTVAILTLLPTAGMAVSGGDGKRGKDRTVDTKGGFDMKPNRSVRGVR
jgi:hypothetical protein